MTSDVAPIKTPLSNYLRDKSDWRATKADEYPDDSRNARSSRDESAAVYTVAPE